MPKAKTKTSSLQSHIRRISNNKLILLAAFVLVFVGFGSWVVYRTEAANCTYSYLSAAAGSRGWCVTVLQDSLGIAHQLYGNVPAPAKDGIYGTQTATSVWYYQKYHTDVKASGAMNPATWSFMCSTLSYYHRNGKYLYFRNEAGTDYTWLGCH